MRSKRTNGAPLNERDASAERTRAFRPVAAASGLQQLMPVMRQMLGEDVDELSAMVQAVRAGRVAGPSRERQAKALEGFDRLWDVAKAAGRLADEVERENQIGCRRLNAEPNEVVAKHRKELAISESAARQWLDHWDGRFHRAIEVGYAGTERLHYVAEKEDAGMPNGDPAWLRAYARDLRALAEVLAEQTGGRPRVGAPRTDHTIEARIFTLYGLARSIGPADLARLIVCEHDLSHDGSERPPPTKSKVSPEARARAKWEEDQIEKWRVALTEAKA